MCNITKKFFFGGVKILPNVANNKDKKKKKTINCINCLCSILIQLVQWLPPFNTSVLKTSYFISL